MNRTVKTGIVGAALVTSVLSASAFAGQISTAEYTDSYCRVDRDSTVGITMTLPANYHTDTESVIKSFTQTALEEMSEKCGKTARAKAESVIVHVKLNKIDVEGQPRHVANRVFKFEKDHTRGQLKLVNDDLKIEPNILGVFGPLPTLQQASASVKKNPQVTKSKTAQSASSKPDFRSPTPAVATSVAAHDRVSQSTESSESPSAGGLGGGLVILLGIGSLLLAGVKKVARGIFGSPMVGAAVGGYIGGRVGSARQSHSGFSDGPTNHLGLLLSAPDPDNGRTEYVKDSRRQVVGSVYNQNGWIYYRDDKFQVLASKRYQRHANGSVDYRHYEIKGSGGQIISYR